MSADRLREIEELGMELENNKVSNLLIKYQKDLEEYSWIDTVEQFSVLRLAHSVKFINKKNGYIYQGLLVKILEEKGIWFALIKDINGKIHRINYNDVYFFYGLNRNERIRKYMDLFIKNYDE